MSEEVRVGVIGAGRMGALHAENLAQRIPGARVAAVADVRPEAAHRCAAAVGAAAAGSAEALLARTDLHAVLIASSTESHAELIARAADRGLHVFCEKPIALTLESIDAALASVDAAGVALQVGFNRRFDPAFAGLRDALAAGEIGALHLLRITSRDLEPPPLDYVRRSGGLFLDMTIHDFDLARFLVGREVRRVSALGASRVDPRIGEVGDVDTALVTLAFDDGALAAIDNSRRAVYGYDQRVEVFGSGGALAAGAELPAAGRAGRPSRAPGRDAQLDRYRESYRRELEAFVRCIREGSPAAVDGTDGRAAVLLGLAARASLEGSRTLDPADVDPASAARPRPARG